MILKALKTNKLLTINYQNNGFVQTVKGYIQNLNLLEQTLLLKDENQHVRSLRLSSIIRIFIDKKKKRLRDNYTNQPLEAAK
ncbi:MULTISPECIES: YolD-like family protein [Priestia]